MIERYLRVFIGFSHADTAKYVCPSSEVEYHNTGCSDDDLIRRITVQAAWGFCGLNRNLRR